ncbi:hypothetical protein UY3_13040 [Chelonia mydas]|uniref:Uncharacterized protein n=1 Tax=Chelonia mydas TaxID=8469 RepID=M7AWK9_CHEMY|nr:hypothetical protein UY3_13040 [Chelonia mydas]
MDLDPVPPEPTQGGLLDPEGEGGTSAPAHVKQLIAVGRGEEALIGGGCRQTGGAGERMRSC